MRPNKLQLDLAFKNRSQHITAARTPVESNRPRLQQDSEVMATRTAQQDQSTTKHKNAGNRGSQNYGHLNLSRLMSPLGG
mgnify:CR=1 FL=1